MPLPAVWLHLVADVDLARRIVADQHDGEPRRDALLAHQPGRVGDLGRAARRDRLAVDDACAHGLSAIEAALVRTAGRGQDSAAFPQPDNVARFTAGARRRPASRLTSRAERRAPWRAASQRRVGSPSLAAARTRTFSTGGRRRAVRSRRWRPARRAASAAPRARGRRLDPPGRAGSLSRHVGIQSQMISLDRGTSAGSG